MLMLVMLMGIMFVSSMQPMFMVSSLIVIVLLYSYMIYMSIGGYWFGYALVLVMLSGVLVVFTYMASLVPNESFESYNLVYVMSILVFLVGGFYFFQYEVKWGLNSLMLWESWIGFFNMFVVSFLLSVMLIVVWLSYLGYGAMRIY